MKPTAVPWIPRALLRGRFACFLFFLLFGMVIYVFLFLSVHNRDVGKLEFRQKYNDTIKVWIEHGYFKHGGLAFCRPVDENQRQKIWRSSSMGFLQAAHLLERISYAWNGGFSQRLMCFHNQAIVWISSALLGFLAFTMVLQYDGRLVSALLLGVSCQSVYQTFPYNLRYYWEIYPSAVICIFAIGYLILVERSLRQETPSGFHHVLRVVIVFGMFYTEPFTAFFFLVTYYLIAIVMHPSVIKGQRHILTIIIPGLAGILLYLGQLYYVKLTYPEVELVGSGWLFRTGLDGSTKYVGDHFGLLFDKRRFLVSGIGNWKYFFMSGLMSMGYLVHLVIPFILSLLAFLPSYLERITKQTGIFVVVATLVAFCYSIVQLRAYAIAYPLESVVTSLSSNRSEDLRLDNSEFNLDHFLPVILRHKNAKLEAKKD
ncbi:MAG: hypothetical protein HY788_18555 [Deltaproteobacteria bacterium]|nr:hypothetical protein [Deltaproteobacteria bacterium]